MSIDETVCPCDVFVHPRRIHNLSGLDEVAYRVGDYATFRQALLRALPDEHELAKWTPSAEGDLGLQLLEWWAYLADILTFYNERIANDAYLRTAYSPESIKRLVALLGYRRRPALGSRGILAGLLTGVSPIMITKGLPLQNEPPPGADTQFFEGDANVLAEAPGFFNVEPVVHTPVGGRTVWLSGVVSSIQPQQELLLVPKNWQAPSTFYAWLVVESVGYFKDPSGSTNTKVTFTQEIPDWPDIYVTDYRLKRGFRETRLNFKPNIPPDLILTNQEAHLRSVVKELSAGQLALFVLGSDAQLVTVTESSEVVWYENAPGENPAEAPGPPHVPVPNLHSVIRFEPDMTIAGSLSSMRVFHISGTGWDLIDGPIKETQHAKLTLTAKGTIPSSFKVGRFVFLEDVKGLGALAKVTSVSSNSLDVERIDTSVPLELPLRVLYNLFPVSQGKTITREILGHGDATQINQTFTLAEGPLTYFAGALPGSEKPYHSTLRVVVNDIAWTEVESFYGQAPDAQVYITQEDEEGKTQVVFGDGIFGATLPTGKNNVVASYRSGAGGDIPEAATLNVLAKPLLNLSAVRNPVAVGGGADAETPAMVRRTGPRSVLAFGRAVSGDDYETISLAAGVPRAKSYFSWDENSQRAMVKLYVGGSPGAVPTAIAALLNAVDFNRPFLVLPATERVAQVKLVLVTNPRYEVEPLRVALREVLLDETNGIFPGGKAQIGAAMYDSWIVEACMRIAGIIGVASLNFSYTPANPNDVGERHDPGEGSFFSLNSDDLNIVFIQSGAAS